MKKENYYILLNILFILIFKINLNNSVSDEEYNCLLPFVTFPLYNKWSQNTNGTYNFCGSGESSTCYTNSSIKEVNLRLINTINQPFIVYPQNFSCLPFLQTLTLNNIKMDPSLMYYQNFQPSLVILRLYKFQQTPQGITQSFPRLNSLLINEGIVGTTIKLKHFSKILSVSLAAGNFNYLESGGVPDPDYRLIQVYFQAKNMPDLTGFPISTIQLLFENTLPTGLISNYSTFQSYSCSMDHLNAQPFYAHLNNNVKRFSHVGILIKPTQPISLKTNTNYERIRYSGFGEDFKMDDGSFPLYEVPKSISITFENGNLSVLPPISLFGDKNNYVVFKNCNIQSSLGPYAGTGFYYDLSDNKISGSIDQTWCSTNLIVSNNSMTGDIPSCFACYFNDLENSGALLAMYDRFANNGFTNWNKNYVCTTFLPRSEVIDINTNKIRVYGNDIGFNVKNWADKTRAFVEAQSETITYGKDYYVILPVTILKSVEYYSIDFILPYIVKYTFPVTKRPPVAKSVMVDATGKQFNISGSFFSTYYNYESQSVSIVGNDCSILSDLLYTNFFQTNCVIPSQIPDRQDGKSQLITITTGTFSKKYLIKTSANSVNNKACSNNCTSDTNGYCDLSSGQCVCNEPWTGSNCDQISCEVPNCNSHGTCQTSSGTCQCFDGYYGSNCEFVRCPIPDCSLHGLCNDTNGKCQCYQGYLGNGCEQIQCAVPNCNSHGTCNTTIGKCQCSQGYLGNDCELIQCSVPDCNSHGLCNTTKGQCQCSQGYFGNSCEQIECSAPDCNSHGICNTNTGKCECSNGYLGNDCELIQCPVPNCNSHGTCNTTTGQCQCSQGYFGNSCEQIQCIDPTCNSQGKCNYNTGQCQCVNNYKGTNCTTPVHFISSINTSTTLGGNAEFLGFFGNIHQGLYVTIGDINCPIISNSSDSIICNAPSGNGVKNSIVYQNGMSVSSPYQYKQIIYKCKNDCSGNGNCDTTSGTCKCNPGWGDFDCSNPINTPTTTTSTSTGNSNESPSNPSNPSTNTTIDGSTGGTNLSNQEITFEIYFTSLLEIDINENIVRNYSLQNNWKFNSTTPSSSSYSSSNSIDKQYKLIQNIQDNNECTIISTIDEILNEDGKEYTFAGTTFKLDRGSIKFSISIYNYSYLNNLNTLRLDLISLVDKDLSKDNGCNDEETEINTNDDGSDSNSNFNYIKISKNNKILSGRFVNKVMSDGRSTYLKTNINRNPDNQESILVSLNLPHAIHSIEVDPDFSVLIAPDFKSNCGESSTRKNWVIPVAVIVPCVGVATIASVSWLYFKKKDELAVQAKLKIIKNNNNKLN